MGRKFYFIELPIGSKMNNDFYAFLMNLGVGYNLVSKSDMVAYEMVIDDVTVDLINSYVRFWNKHYADDEFMPELESMPIEWLY